MPTEPPNTSAQGEASAPTTAIEELTDHLKSDPLFSSPDNSPALILAFSPIELRLCFLNKTAAERLDPKNETAWHEITLHDMLGVSTPDHIKQEIVAHIQVIERWSGKITLRDMWGSEFHAQCRFSTFHPKTNPSKTLICLQASELLKEETVNTFDTDRHFLHALLETSPDTIYFKDSQSRFLRVSRTLATRCGFTNPRHMIGKTDFDFFTPEHANHAYQDEQRIIHSGEHIVNKVERETWGNGLITWACTTKLPLRDKEGKIIGTYGISRDVTLEKAAEEEHQEMQIKLQLSNKLESIGRLAAGVAHEINTPTQYITDNTLFLKDAFTQLLKVVTAYREYNQYDCPSRRPDCATLCQNAHTAEQNEEIDYLLNEIPKTIQQTIDGLGRVTRIVRSLKEFSHPNALGKNPVNLNDILQTAITVSRHEWKLVADVVTDLDPDLPSVPCILDQFNQVLLNLIINAAHTISDALKAHGETKGIITIRTRHNSTHAIVEVTDTGLGIPEKIRDRIFEPFFTTKDVGKGTGQGLNVVRTVIIENHQGLVEFETQISKGTTFRLFLPLTDSSNASSQS